MKVLVTGGAGFIGSHLVRELLAKGHIPSVFDNFSNSHIDTVSFLDSDKIIKGDITDIQQITKAAANHDAVIHLAAKISVEESVRNPKETFRVNVQGTENVLKACSDNNIKKIIVASSAAVYGESDAGSTITEDSRTEPISPYGQSKLEMENMIRAFAKKEKSNCIILRFFNVYGPNQSDDYAGVISKFNYNIQEGKPLEIFGDGSQTRDFVSISDVIDAIILSLENTDGKFGTTYNIASGDCVTIKYLASLMLGIFGKKLAINHLKPKDGEIRFSRPSISLAKKEIGFNPKYRLEDGVRKYFKN